MEKSSTKKSFKNIDSLVEHLRKEEFKELGESILFEGLTYSLVGHDSEMKDQVLYHSSTANTLDIEKSNDEIKIAHYDYRGRDFSKPIVFNMSKN
jgi:hypothetical protein